MRVFFVVIGFLTLLASNLTLFAGKALAQVELGGDKKDKEPLEIIADEEARRRKQTDKDYQATMKRTRGNTPSAPSDPWSSVRAAPTANDKK